MRYNIIDTKEKNMKQKQQIRKKKFLRQNHTDLAAALRQMAFGIEHSKIDDKGEAMDQLLDMAMDHTEKARLFGDEFLLVAVNG
jgi:hypothetical protein